MKVILLQEVKGQGGEGDVVEVARGFAVNYLFPKSMAIQATKGNLKQLDARRHNIEKRETQRLDTAEKLLSALNQHTVIVRAREGQLFGSVTTTAVAAAIGEQIGAEVDRKRIELSAPIKTVGEHDALVSIYRDVKATVTVKVIDEKEASSDRSEESGVAEAAEAAAEDATEEAALAEVVAAAVETAAAAEEASAEDVAAAAAKAEATEAA